MPHPLLLISLSITTIHSQVENKTRPLKPRANFCTVATSLTVTGHLCLLYDETEMK